MNVVVWLFTGGIAGWIASLVMHAEDRLTFGMNMLVGIAGALIGGWIVSSLISGATINQGVFSGVALMFSVAGAIMLLVAFSVVRRRTPIKLS